MKFCFDTISKDYNHYRLQSIHSQDEITYFRKITSNITYPPSQIIVHTFFKSNTQYCLNSTLTFKNNHLDPESLENKIENDLKKLQANKKNADEVLYIEENLKLTTQITSQISSVSPTEKSTTLTDTTMASTSIPETTIATTIENTRNLIWHPQHLF